MKRLLSFLGLVLGLTLFATPALANEITAATASADCTGYTLSVQMELLTPGTAYEIDYSFTLTPTSGPPVTVTGTIDFTASASTDTETASGTWPGAPLSAGVTATGSATLTSSGSTAAIIINGATSAVLSCGGNGRMTGGGSVFTASGIRVTHGFELHCEVSDLPNRLEINWPGNRFHLETLVAANCFNDPTINAGHPTNIFNTYVGSGTGTLNGAEGATANWTFTDAGEPGTNDTATIVITDPLGNVVLTVSGRLDSGNQQAHVDNK